MKWAICAQNTHKVCISNYAYINVPIKLYQVPYMFERQTEERIQIVFAL